jgi:hypothetical protein
MKRLSKNALFRRLSYEPHEGQQLVHASTAPRRVLACGARWGKSMCGAHEAIAAALQPCERSTGWVVAPTYDLADRVFRLVTSTVTEHLEHRVVELKEREKWLTITNMGGGVSEIRAKTADNPVSLLGEALDWVIVDEAARLPPDIWQGHLAQRLVDREGWALLLSTPRGLNWFFRIFQQGQKGRDPSIESWRSPTWANPHLPEGVVEAEKARLTKDAFDQEFGAVFLGEEDDPCGRCGCPSERVSGNLLVWGDDPIPNCGECGGHVDGEGATLVRKVPGWQNYLKIVRVMGDYSTPELPGALHVSSEELGESSLPSPAS